MSHIPNSAMKHAGPTHHEEEAKPTKTAKPAPRSGISGSLIALGGTLLVGAVAAVAVPLWRRHAGAEANSARKPRARKPAAAKANGKGAAKHAGAKSAKADTGAKTSGHKSATPKQADA
ncbi:MULTISPECIES: hypothetical protein [unclassified Sphingomonas]|jgi:hypothetical protein|uniref:hypothetical protein n=1 Tax=unclassified Sphingomonas TaxID=196159 RepID=UPI00226A8424|nr:MULTISPECIES: hypothetical protein [unclassified Sphingomonas]